MNSFSWILQQINRDFLVKPCPLEFKKLAQEVFYNYILCVEPELKVNVVEQFKLIQYCIVEL